ncbi:ribonuclease H-like domain-containing protein [Favolaschia claudopus]|uniref:3'-5' exonuclease n=1 Tax=Favolaschia claudopus TaxID=2862362 RepID=A0AAW0BTQ6_9AGAR
MASEEPRFAPDSAAIRINLGSTDLAPLELTFKAFLLTDVEEANKHLDSIQSHSVVGLDTEYKELANKPARAKLCVVQIAVERRVYVLDMTAMQTCPDDLRRILEDPSIIKCGAGLNSDAQVLWTALHVNARSFRDVGHMSRIAFPVHYRAVSHPLSMQRCVEDILHRSMDKTDQRADWHLGLTDTAGGRDVQKLFRYAALDAQASLQIYRVLDECLLETAMQRKVRIPGEWITYHCVEGKPMRTATDVNGKHVEWSFTIVREVESPFGHRPPVAVNRPCDADPLNLRRLATSNTDTEHA